MLKLFYFIFKILTDFSIRCYSTDTYLYLSPPALRWGKRFVAVVLDTNRAQTKMICCLQLFSEQPHTKNVFIFEFREFFCCCSTSPTARTVLRLPTPSVFSTGALTKLFFLRFFTLSREIGVISSNRRIFACVYDVRAGSFRQNVRFPRNRFACSKNFTDNSNRSKMLISSISLSFFRSLDSDDETKTSRFAQNIWKRFTKCQSIWILARVNYLLPLIILSWLWYCVRCSCATCSTKCPVLTEKKVR